MILYLDTSAPTTKLWVDDSYSEHETHRTLARDILKIITTKVASLSDLSGIAVFKGPGSFTGLRIGITVANALSDQLKISIVGEMGENWRDKAKQRLKKDENDRLILPEYGRPANITAPKK